MICLEFLHTSGSLSIMVGGKKQNLETCMPVLEAMGSRIEYMGEAGAGAAAKLVNQVGKDT